MSLNSKRAIFLDFYGTVVYEDGEPIRDIVSKLCHESGADFEGHFWYNTIRSNNDYPHAPWWHTESDSTCHNDYNPTACLAGFIIRFAERGSDLYSLGERIAKEAFDAYMEKEFLNDMHTAGCYIRLYAYLTEAGAEKIIDLAALRDKLQAQVKHSITSDTAAWETSYICKPSQFFNSCDSVFYADNKVIADYECEYIIKTQLDDGSWAIPWGWNAYPEEWAVAKNWWKANGAILNLLYLKGMGQIVWHLRIISRSKNHDPQRNTLGRNRAAHTASVHGRRRGRYVS